MSGLKLFSLFVIAICPGILGGAITYLSIKKKWNARLIVSFFISFSIFFVNFLFWLAVKETWLLIGGLLLSIFNGITVYRSTRFKKIFEQK